MRVLAAACVVTLLLAGTAEGGVRLQARDEPVPIVLSRGAQALPARAAPFRFNLVGLHWRGAGSVWFRTAGGDGWSAWRPARPEAEDMPDPGGREAAARSGWKLGNPYWTGSATRIQYRLSGQVARLRAHFIWSEVRTPAPQRRLAEIPGAPPVLTRADWGADESIVRGEPAYAERLGLSVVHHTAGSSPASPAQSAAIVRGIQTYHVRSNGWNDVGYNFLVDSFGQVFEGRAGGVTRNVIGAHAQGFNTGSVGVAILGTYESGPITVEARQALVDLLSWRLDLAHVDPASTVIRVSAGSPKYAAGTTVSLRAVSGHRDTGATACPGTALYAELDPLADEAATSGGAKLFDPRVTGSLGHPIRFTARLSEPRPWSVTVYNGSGAPVAGGSGSGSSVDWTWNAGGVSAGRYTYAIEAGSDVRAARGPVGPLVPLELTALRVSPLVSPNADGVGDSAEVRVIVTRRAGANVFLTDASGKRVATIVSARALEAGTSTITWRPSSRIADGRYRIAVEVSEGGERAAGSAPIVVDRTLGHLSVRPAAFSPNGDGRFDTAVVSYRLVRQATVRARVVLGSRTVATLASGGQTGPVSLTWPGTGAPNGRLTAVVEARTSLGTRRLTRALVLDTQPPRLAGLVAKRSRRGTLVRFRLGEPARLVIRIGRKTVRLSRGAGVVTVWRRARPKSVSVLAVDRVANERSATAPVRRR